MQHDTRKGTGQCKTQKDQEQDQEKTGRTDRTVKLIARKRASQTTQIP